MEFQGEEGFAVAVPDEGDVAIVLGRDAIGGKDKSVSRRQVEISGRAADGALRATVCGTNDSAVVASKGEAKRLRKGESAELRPGDRIELLFGRYGFTLLSSRKKADDPAAADAAADAADATQPSTPPLAEEGAEAAAAGKADAAAALKRASTLHELGELAEYAVLMHRASDAARKAAATKEEEKRKEEEDKERERRYAIAALHSAFPGVENDVLEKKLAEAAGSVERALELLFADQRKPAPAPAPVAKEEKPMPPPPPAAAPPAAAEQTPRQRLEAVFPDMPAEKLDAALAETGGDVDAAAAKILAGPAPVAAAAAKPVAEEHGLAPPAEKKRRTPLQMLSAVFPDVELSLLEMALKENGGDLEKASDWLSGGGGGGGGRSAPAAPAPAAPARAAAMEEAYENRGEVRVVEWDDSPFGGGFMPGHYVKRGKRRVYIPGPAIPPKHGSTHRATIKIDMRKPCQSLRDLPQDPVALLTPVCRQFGKNAQFALYVFQTMLEREQQLYPDFFCFYHSFSYAILLYEVQAELARAIYSLPDEFAPLPRILRKPFDGMPLLEMLIDDYKKLGSDHNPAYRALAVSTSISLFAPSSEAPPTSCLLMGYSCMDLSFRGLLTGFFEACGVPHYRQEELADACIEVGEKFKLPTAPYRARPAAGGFAFGGMPGANTDEAPGHMLQIFVHKDYVDAVAYHSKPYGVPTGEKSIAKVLSHGVCDGQARVFMIPDVFVDHTKSRLFHYCANASLACMDPAVPGSRGAFIQELRKVLAPIIGDYASLRKARRGIEGLP